MKYKKKPVVIEATQWFKIGDHSNVKPWSYHQTVKCQECKQLLTNHGACPTLEGEHIVCPGDWIITGVKGEIYPCKPDIFDMTYEKVDD